MMNAMVSARMGAWKCILDVIKTLILTLADAATGSLM
jgi:hypothetical protein